MSNIIGTVMNFTVTPKSKSTELSWTDPDDIIVDGLATDFWTCTKILRKTTGYPTSITDGVVVVSSTIRNQYQTDPFVDTGLEKGMTYYYSAFTVGSHVNDVSFNQEPCIAEAFVASYKTMTVNINFNESDPTKMCSYADDAVGAPCGLNDEATAFWQEFFGYRPCLFKNGAVVGYLNPNDYTKFENGTSADITSGNSGDVMIEYPRRGVKMSKSGNVVTISVTDDPDVSGFTYYAHTRGTTRREAFYLGAYLGYVTSNKLRSLSGKTNTNSISLSSYRTYAGNLGSGYTTMTYYQYLYIQIMYCFQFSNNLNSQNVLGKGKYSNRTYTCSAGSANTKGVVFGTPGTTGELKLFGLENPWGVAYQFIDGYFASASLGGVILTATDGFNDSGSGYTSSSQTLRSNSYGYISNVEGSAELGFTPAYSGLNGSETTYLCDYAYLKFSDFVPNVWGSGVSSTDFGVFYFFFRCDPSNSGSDAGSRLAY